MDLIADRAFDGRRLRILTIAFAATRFCPAIEVRATYRGADVVETQERVRAIHGRQEWIRIYATRDQAPARPARIHRGLLHGPSPAILTGLNQPRRDRTQSGLITSTLTVENKTCSRLSP